MNKRDYFAAQAMQAIIAKMPLTLKYAVTYDDEDYNDEDVNMLMKAVAKGAYGYADAMIEQRTEEE